MAQKVSALSASEERPPLTLTQLAWRRFRRHRMALLGAVLLILILL
jgi:ABC-type antimicrobial peptide transport system permease subunit